MSNRDTAGSLMSTFVVAYSQEEV